MKKFRKNLGPMEKTFFQVIAIGTPSLAILKSVLCNYCWESIQLPENQLTKPFTKKTMIILLILYNTKFQIAIALKYVTRQRLKIAERHVKLVQCLY